MPPVGWSHEVWEDLSGFRQHFWLIDSIPLCLSEVTRLKRSFTLNLAFSSPDSSHLVFSAFP